MPAKPMTKRNGKPTRKPKGKPATPPPDVLTLDSAAELLRVSAKGLRADAENGLVPGQLVGGEWRFSRAGLFAWLATPPAPPNARQLSTIGSMADDDTLPAMVDEIYRRRQE